jgi:CRP/FNR family transcriptional regulator, cyclic AMP receptor protein
MLATIDPTTLADTDLFRGLSVEQLRWLGQRLRRKIYPAESNIITAEQPGEIIYVIVSGTVKIHVEQADGSDVIISILGPGDTVGEMSVFDGTLRSANVATLEASTLLWMDRSTFHESLRAIPQLTTNLVRIMSYRLCLANLQIQSLATLNVYGRIARQLIAFADRYGKVGPNGDVVIPIRLTQGDIADLVGASLRRVNQVMVVYKQRKLLSVDGDNHITLHDRENLTSYYR